MDSVSNGNFPENFVATFLRLHNQYRAMHNVPPLQINEKMNEYAQEWADALAKKGILEYRPETKYGENLCKSERPRDEREMKPTDPLEEWYREGRFFMYGQEQPQNAEKVRSFTQMIWRGSKMIGLGMAFDKEGITYFVCNYDPPGNVEGKFADNVLPLKEEGRELLEHEAEGIRVVKPRLAVVNSMERLYAVPSEKLRVWSIWLMKVGDVAHEWQRWLRAHIDLTVRLSELLYEAELAIQKPEVETVSLREGAKKASKMERDIEDAVPDIRDSVRTEHEGSIYEEAIDMSPAEVTNGSIESPDNQLNQEASERDIGEISETTLKGESSVTLTPSKATVIKAPGTASTVASRNTVVEVQGTASRVASKNTVVGARGTSSTAPSRTTVVQVRSTTSATSRKSKAPRVAMIPWPIGIPWEHLGLEEVREEEEFEKLPLPRNEHEMRELLKKFTQQATIYRSYYKHWQETANQATKEIGGRLVLETFRVQGKDERGEIKRPPRAKPCNDDRNEGGDLSERGSIKTNYGQLNASTTTTRTAISEYNRPKPCASQLENPSTMTLRNRSQQRLTRRIGRCLEVADWIRSCARAVEPVPYVFYVKAEPDIDIAIENDDEEVILADVDREAIATSRKRIFFNLKDKPCKGGKPWI